jgi:hypothetical protein
MKLYFLNDEDLNLNSIISIVLHVIFYMNKNIYKFWNILIIFLFEEKYLLVR